MSGSNQTQQQQQITPLKTIESAINLIDPKKQTLKRAFDELQSHSSLISSFSLSWSDIDSHFSSVQSGLTRRFLRLQEHPVRPDPEVLNTVPPTRSTEYPPARKELKLFCEKMDGKGLGDYMSENSKDREAIRAELIGLFVGTGTVRDLGEIVLDAMQGFYHVSHKDADFNRKRKGCLDLLEVICEIKAKLKLSDEVKLKAKKLALDWKNLMNSNVTINPLEALGFMNFVAAFDLKVDDVFSNDSELLDYFFAVARFKEATDLARAIGLGDKTNDLVQKLMDNGKHLLAVKFVFDLGLADKFPPALLLKNHLTDCENYTIKSCTDERISVRAQNEAICRQINAVKVVLQYIDQHNLQFEYSRLDLEKRIEMLEKQKEKIAAAPSSDNRPQQLTKRQKLAKQQAKKQQMGGNKHPRVPAPAAVAISAAGSSQQSYLPQAGLLPAAEPYGLASYAPPITSYAGALAGPYGSARSIMGFPGNPGPVVAHPYSSDPYTTPGGYYDRPSVYNGYGHPSQYYPGYIPQ
ncbi:truncated FRIGIDA-like protein 1 [Mercurialis annua]|uniref:truncated FRIGIDA-like protein 1 n=1 Tax=Mercurialis annua TaxID=3986 RepID=UPI00215F5AC1|nr:truncated FRIGIDA-like protein 1 [Mercurialis annua]